MVVIVILFALFMLLTSASGLGDCPKCGEMEVPYPLSTQEGCGHSSYRVYCNNGSLEFRSLAGSYYKVLSIDPDAYTLIINAPKIEEDVCYSSDLRDGGFKIDESSPFNISKRNTVMLFNCSDSILLSPLNCSLNSLCRQFEKTEAAKACMGTLCCSFLKDASISSHRIRVRVGGCTAYTSVVDIGPEESPAAWNYGIELQWQPLFS
ncbi:hypothetical protein MRB53_031817 [Persea americana]|uniref:Uncharacterized protein n=1 Tax=Persea americana TaxID=3435 RepID=A0ACC2KQ51_PERAE|nr:hypothetical protein MRB53_031817 [Persea americana]